MSTTWRHLVAGLFKDAGFAPPCTADELDGAERELGVKLPQELRSCYLETNGIKANYGASLVWPVMELVAQNQRFREAPDFPGLYLPFDCLLFFGAEGNGNQFAYRILAGAIPDTSWIYRWDHENDSRTWFAGDLADYFRRSVPSDE